MRHPSDGTLRRLLDEPVGVADPDREHVADCPVCLSGLAAAQQDADAARTALETPPGPELDVAAGVDERAFGLTPARGTAGRPVVLSDPAARLCP